MQKLDKSWLTLKKLPSQAQLQVIDFIAFLNERYTQGLTDQEPESKTPLLQEPFIGVWKTRTEMKERASYVREMRNKEWQSK